MYISMFVTSLVLSFLIPTVSYTCIHHEVSHKDVPVTRVLNKSTRVKRHLFVPLHIHVHMDGIDHGVHENVRQSIDIALKKVVKFFRETIEVRQTISPFLFERLNCVKKWQSGVNKDKCSQLKSGPEFCSTKLTDYIIPDAYLSKLEVYNYTDTNPHQVLKKGQGLQEANFILFVISRSTSWCAESDIQAYGSYCRLDNENRPVAGLLNMCPSKFSKKLFRASHYFNVIMHEVIHILGFSHHLYPKFKTCHSVNDCEIPKKIVHTDAHNIQRLVFPEVVKSMQAHFNCSEPKFGAPLEPYKRDDRTSNDNKYTSHWHPVLMFTSIMTPSLTEESYIVVDNITLALLHSTGWYKVNFEKAQKFMFGKGTGCNFGFEDNCENYNPHCLPSNNDSSCDILEYAIGKCESIVPYHPCVVHKTKEEVEGNTVPLNCSNGSDFCLSKKCSCKYDSSLSIFLRMHLKDLTTSMPIEYSNFTSIEPFTIWDMAMPIRDTRNGSLASWEYIDICLPSNTSSEELDKKTRDFLQCSYMHISEGGKEQTEVKLAPEIAVPSNVHDGFHTLFIILAVCGILLIAVLISFALRFSSKSRQIRESLALKDIH